jgi:DinB family protein
MDMKTGTLYRCANWTSREAFVFGIYAVENAGDKTICKRRRMKELKDYRKNLIEKLVNTARDFRTASLSVKDPYQPLEDGGWNVHQTAVHTCDVDRLVYSLRARRTIEEDNPEFQNFDGDTYMAEHYNANEPLGELLNGFVENVESLAELLRSLPDAAWSRKSRHATLGSGFTLQTWVERSLAHMEEHLEFVKR